MPYRKLNLDEAADYLHLSVGELEELVHHREIPCEQAGKRLSFAKRELDAWASTRIMGMKPEKLSSYQRRSFARTRQENDPDTPVRLATLLRLGKCVPELPARTKASVLRELVRAAAGTDLVNDQAELLASLQEREDLCSTGMPGGFAIPHPRHHDPYRLENSFVLLGRTPHPVPFGAPDGRQTDLFFLACCACDKIHLHVLARLCLLCREADFLEELRAAPDAATMLEVVEKAEAALG